MGLTAFIDFLYEIKDQNGEEDKGIPETNIKSVTGTIIKVLKMLRQLTFSIYRVKVLKLTIPLPDVDDVAVAPIATAAVVATGDGAHEALPSLAVLCPRQVQQVQASAYKYPENEKLAEYGQVFLATAKNAQNLKKDPERIRLVKSVKDNGDIREFERCPVCQKPVGGFSAKKVFYKHIRDRRCSEKDIKDFAGVDLEERRSAKVKENKEKNVEAGGPDVDPVDADSLPSYYAGYPEKPLNSMKIATIMVKLAGAATEQDHA